MYEGKRELVQSEIKCEEIESCRNTDAKNIHRKIKEMAGGKSCSSSGCIKSKERAVLFKKENTWQRCTQYTGELFLDDQGEKN